ncbi:hypothetical protein EDB85DRAFT_1888129 [Lactarius pseudohatsudake]|nr:hypothetical protein EDB85DRAFT_1888129 [Lactarius pseudohatsudake]
MSLLVSSDDIRISFSVGNTVLWSSSMSHGGLSHSAYAWTMGIPTRRHRIRKVGDEFEFEAPESIHVDVHWSLHVIPVAAKLRGCKGWGSHRGNADTDAVQQGQKLGRWEKVDQHGQVVLGVFVGCEVLACLVCSACKPCLKVQSYEPEKNRDRTRLQPMATGPSVAVHPARGFYWLRFIQIWHLGEPPQGQLGPVPTGLTMTTASIDNDTYEPTAALMPTPTTCGLNSNNRANTNSDDHNHHSDIDDDTSTTKTTTLNSCNDDTRQPQR